MAKHKPEREERARSRRLAELRQENRNLKRSLERAQKELNRKILSDSSMEDMSVRIPKKKCPKCNEPAISYIQGPTKTYLVCRNCLYRGPLTAA